jgi:hypothetical protein
MLFGILKNMVTSWTRLLKVLNSLKVEREDPLLKFHR